MTEEAINALKALARLPIEDMAIDCTSDDSIVFMVGDNGRAAYITVGHVRDARAALGDRPKTLLEEVQALRAIVNANGGLSDISEVLPRDGDHK